MTTERTGKNRQAIETALLQAGKRAALAEQLGISEGQLSKMANGELHRFAQLLAVLGLEIHPSDYVAALERVLKERL